MESDEKNGYNEQDGACHLANSKRRGWTSGSQAHGGLSLEGNQQGLVFSLQGPASTSIVLISALLSDSRCPSEALRVWMRSFAFQINLCGTLIAPSSFPSGAMMELRGISNSYKCKWRLPCHTLLYATYVFP